MTGWPPPIFELHVPELDHSIRTIGDGPERLFIAWHRTAHGVYELLDDQGRGPYGRPQESLWEVREYRRGIVTDGAAWYEPVKEAKPCRRTVEGGES